MQTTNYTGAWQQVAAGKTALLVSTTGTAELFIGGVAPAATDSGMKVGSEFPYTVPNLDTFGGSAWVRGRVGDRFTYVTD